jgi:hypothetical protein
LLWSVYSLRNLWARRVTTLLTLSGLGLVVFVFVAILMLAHGLERTMGRTGDPSNAILLSKGALSEIESSLSRDQTGVLAAQPEVVTLADHQVAGGARNRFAAHFAQAGARQPGQPFRPRLFARCVCRASPPAHRTRAGMAARHHGSDRRQPGGQAVSRSPAG